MSALFSVAFTVIFVAFVLAAILGHVLLIQALVRPFFGKLAATKQSSTSNALLASR